MTWSSHGPLPCGSLMPARADFHVATMGALRLPGCRAGRTMRTPGRSHMALCGRQVLPISEAFSFWQLGHDPPMLRAKL